MHDPAPQRWRLWRAAPLGLPNRLARAVGGPPDTPGPDGIRWGLVNRVRAEIAAGIYDTDAKWAAAEDLLLRRVEEMA